MKNYLITGATGFIGLNILNKLKNKRKIRIFYTYRSQSLKLKNNNIIGVKVNFENLNDIKKLKNILEKIDIIIHCANLAHNDYPSKLIRKVNYLATINLVKLAKVYNVKKFIFLSTAKINMNYNKNINSENDISRKIKKDLYTNIKYKTEVNIKKILKSSKVDCLILRPALVYGKNVQGNLKKLNVFIRLSKYLPLPLPLPFLNANEKKSFCSINNLINCIENISVKKIGSNTFIVCDDMYYSFRDLIIYLFKKQNKKIILFPVKIFFFKIFFILANKQNVFNSIFSRMILDNSKIKRKLKIKLHHNLYNIKY